MPLYSKLSPIQENISKQTLRRPSRYGLYKQLIIYNLYWYCQDPSMEHLEIKNPLYDCRLTEIEKSRRCQRKY